ncbi:hypothetical protein QGP82_18695 [Leptothoe sp. LEGE 181152]|uniref:Uncharacterized protein n=1 Tax=Adonisia turfae CCMR0081 TaxID=2292702 RepID=A0A6M0RXA1_9CYAN|nr:hypothetical protein [Adonisia turfae]MDV3350744.1 hypothetical protein [Leptothoe sp. LEGE 181152]NEZ60342.1 hypothetical protein [Adonisia turfae CCMR0081]
MAAAMTTSATSIEGQALEVARELQVLEAAQSTADVPLNNVQIDTDIESGLVSITMTLPTALSGTGGAFTLSASEYLS